MKKRPENFGRTYSAEELSFIEDNSERKLAWIARQLNRPVDGIRVQMIKMGLGDFNQEAGTYTASGLGRIIGVSATTVARWIEQKGLRGKKRTRFSGVSQTNIWYHITIEDFWKWAFKHQDLVDFTKIEIDSLPPEPEWVEPVRRVQFTKGPKQKLYTTDEDSRLWSCYMMGMKQKDIATTLGRSLSSIERRLKILRRDKFNESIQQKAE
jgi:hypothetical protein